MTKVGAFAKDLNQKAIDEAARKTEIDDIKSKKTALEPKLKAYNGKLSPLFEKAKVALTAVNGVRGKVSPANQTPVADLFNTLSGYAQTIPPALKLD